jgi:hypothetical protein
MNLYPIRKFRRGERGKEWLGGPSWSPVGRGGAFSPSPSIFILPFECHPERQRRISSPQSTSQLPVPPHPYLSYPTLPLSPARSWAHRQLLQPAQFAKDRGSVKDPRWEKGRLIRVFLEYIIMPLTFIVLLALHIICLDGLVQLNVIALQVCNPGK